MPAYQLLIPCGLRGLHPTSAILLVGCCRPVCHVACAASSLVHARPHARKSAPSFSAGSEQMAAAWQGRAQFQIYQRYLALAFAAVQGSGQLFFLRQFAPDYSPLWFLSNLSVLVAGAMVLIYVCP